MDTTAAAPQTRIATTIHITALDGIVNVNSLFTLAVFIGLSWNPADPTNGLIDGTNPKCVARSQVAEDLVSFHVYSFSSFLFSSLVALALKQAIRGSWAHFPRTLHLSDYTFDLALVNKNLLRVGYLVSAAGSVSGCVFLMLALVNVVQIKLGTLGCGSYHTYGAVVPLSKGIKGAGECRKSSPDAGAIKLAPCGPAAMNEKATPSSGCCLKVKKLCQNPSCLCAVLQLCFPTPPKVPESNRHDHFQALRHCIWSLYITMKIERLKRVKTRCPLLAERGYDITFVFLYFLLKITFVQTKLIG
ncbi:hypothetical protein Vadar_022170 [Vaccinium darrowii]|uniref:Uncharacterized protein n=1 Tax=Vaccinium darrowii TaxID=229202 RepID=A0ACB7YPU3_9ERIC|nr:hypothetical protein Vadar_022170 [Vaccinium darrowii]